MGLLLERSVSQILLENGGDAANIDITRETTYTRLL